MWRKYLYRKSHTNKPFEYTFSGGCVTEKGIDKGREKEAYTRRVERESLDPHLYTINTIRRAHTYTETHCIPNRIHWNLEWLPPTYSTGGIKRAFFLSLSLIRNMYYTVAHKHIESIISERKSVSFYKAKVDHLCLFHSLFTRHCSIENCVSALLSSIAVAVWKQFFSLVALHSLYMCFFFLLLRCSVSLTISM